MSRSFWDALVLLPEFTEVFVSAPTPEHLIGKLSQFRRIRLSDVHPIVAARLGLAVEKYESYTIYRPKPLDADAILELKNCPRINLLSIDVEENAQDAVVDLISSLPCLEYLTLSFASNHIDGYNRGIVVDLIKGTMNNVAKVAPKLNGLDLKARVPSSEWEPILSRTGNHLKFLCLQYNIEFMELYELFLKLCSLLPRFCRMLKILRLPTSTPYPDENPEKRHVDILLSAARRLQRTFPALNFGRLEEDIEELCKPEKQEENEDTNESNDDTEDESDDGGRQQ